MSLWSSISGKDSAKAAQSAASSLADAARQGSSLRADAYQNAGNQQATAATNAGGALSQAYLDSMGYARNAYGQADNALNQGFNQASSYYQPYLDAGTQASGRLSQGLGDGSLTRAFSMADFQADPNYQYQLKQGQDAIQSGAAASGSLQSGATLKNLNNFNSGMASDAYNTSYNRFNQDQANQYSQLFGATQMGQNASNAIGNMAYNNASNLANNQTGLASALANAYMGSQQANANGLMGAAGFNAQGLLNSTDAKAQGYYDQANAMAAGITGAANARTQGITGFFTPGGVGSMGGGKTA